MNDVLLPGLRHRRKAAGLTLGALGAAVGCTGAAVGMWERGDYHPAADKLPALAQALGCSIDELYREPAGRGVAQADLREDPAWDEGRAIREAPLQDDGGVQDGPQEDFTMTEEN